MLELDYDFVESPIGLIALIVSDGKLCRVDFLDGDEAQTVANYEANLDRTLARRFGNFKLKPTHDPQGFSTRLCAYLAGDLNAIDPIPVETGGTPFQQAVWHALRDIPVGAVMSYGQLACKLGKDLGASRAIGITNSRNPVGIVLPCHRVIGADGALTGYAGGLQRKEWLLRHEGVDLEALSRKQGTILPVQSHVQGTLF